MQDLEDAIQFLTGYFVLKYCFNFCLFLPWYFFQRNNSSSCCTAGEELLQFEQFFLLFLFSLFTSSMFSFFLLQGIYRARGIRAVEESTITSAIMCVTLLPISYNMIDEYLNTVCRTWTFASTYWVLHDFSNQCEDTRLDDGQNFSDLTPFLLCSFI